jgi:long-chain acyl-CoA synthetase
MSDTEGPSSMRLFETLDQFGDQPSLIDPFGATVSYKELVDRAGKAVQDLGKRQLVFCLCSNTVASIIGYVGLVRNGHVCVMLPKNIELDRLESLSDLFSPNYIFAPLEVLQKFKMKESHRVEEYGFVKISGRVTTMDSDLLLLMTTSGSTGNPMLVRISSDNATSNAASIIQSLGLTSDDRALTTLPMNYTYGLSIINSQLQIGGSLVVSDATVTERQFWNLATNSGATYFGGVPYTYQMLKRIGITKLAGSRLRMLTQAGGKLDEESILGIHSDCASIGIEFCVMYGQTEATARMSVLQSSDVPEHPWSIGHAIPGGKFRVIDIETGFEVPQGETGELEYHGPNVAMGYATSRNDLCGADSFGGSITTGDLAVVEADGFLRIVGRRKRFVKIYGNRVNLDDIESFLNISGLQSACTGIDDRITAHVVGAQPIDTASVQQLVAKFIGAHKNSVEIRLISEVPRTDSGKVLYSALIGDSDDYRT